MKIDNKKMSSGLSILTLDDKAKLRWKYLGDTGDISEDTYMESFMKIIVIVRDISQEVHTRKNKKEF